MTRFQVDDDLCTHRKARKAGLAAMGLWVVAGSYCGQQGTDGFVPEWYVLSWPQGKALAGKLVAAALWVVDEVEGEKGWRFHEYLPRNKSRAEIETDREHNRERQQSWRDSQRLKRTTNKPRNAERNALRNGSPPPLVTDPHTYTYIDTTQVSTQPDSSDARDEPAGLAEQLLAEHVAACGGRVARQPLNETGRHIAQLLHDGRDPDLIRSGLAAWRVDGNMPSSIPHFVDKATRRRAGTQLAVINGGRPHGGADGRVLDGLELAARLRQEEPS